MNSSISLKTKPRRVMFISSQGGHLAELLQLEKLINGYNSSLITENKTNNLYLSKKFPKVNFLKYGTRSNAWHFLLIFIYNIICSFFLFLKYRPEAIITTGTHTAVPMCYIGKIFFSKIIFIETIANQKEKSLSGKITEPIADYIFVQWPNMEKIYSNGVYKGRVF